MIRFFVAIALVLLFSTSTNAAGGSRYGCQEYRWCGCWLQKHLGIKSNLNLNIAFQWLKIGRPSGPKVGAIVVFKHSHVGKVTQILGHGKIRVMSGNDGSTVRDRVRRTSTVLAYRVLKD